MKMMYVNGFNNLQRNNRPVYFDQVVSRILTEVLFKSRTHTTIDPNTTLIDTRYYKVIYFRNEDKYLLIGREKTEKLDWSDLPSSVKTMIFKKDIELIVE